MKVELLLPETCPPCASRPHGVALLAVLWIVAALSVMVSSMSTTTLREIRGATLAKATVSAHARALAAINLTLRDIKAENSGVGSRQRIEQRLIDNNSVTVVGTPLSGLIDLNHAPGPLLAMLFQVTGQKSPSTAMLLAQGVLDRRLQRDAQNRPLRLDTPSELLSVPGMDYDTYARSVRLVTTDARSDGRVNINAAPDSVLNVLAGGNTALAAQLSSLGSIPNGRSVVPGVNPLWVGSSPTTRWMLEAVVNLDAGRQFKLRRIIDLEAKDGLPWQIFRSEHQIETILQ